MLIIFISITLICSETWEKFRIPVDPADPKCDRCAIFVNKTDVSLAFSLLGKTKLHPGLVYLDLITISFLTVVTILTLLCFPKVKCTTQVATVTDALACVSLIPSWIYVSFIGLLEYRSSSRGITSMLLLAVYVLRIFRVFFFFRLRKYYRPFAVLMMSLSASVKELLLLAILLLVGVTFYGTLIFYVELGKDTFHNISYGLWWALVTMTTVGYGDLYPVSAQGYAVGCACAVTGVIIVALPIPVIANNFNMYYACVQQVDLLRQRNKKLKGIMNSPNNIYH